MIFTNKDSNELDTFIISGRSKITRNFVQIEIHASSQRKAKAMFAEQFPTYAIKTIREN
jgi:hypothetical protein